MKLKLKLKSNNMKNFYCYLTLFAVLLAAFSASCSPRTYPSGRDTVTETRVRDVPRDTVVNVKPDTSVITAIVVKDRDGGFSLRDLRSERTSGRISARMEMDREGNVRVTSVVDSLGIYLTLRDRYTETATTVTETRYVEVYRMRWYQKTLAWTGALALALLAAAVLFRLFKHRLNGIFKAIKLLDRQNEQK